MNERGKFGQNDRIEFVGRRTNGVNFARSCARVSFVQCGRTTARRAEIDFINRTSHAQNINESTSSYRIAIPDLTFLFQTVTSLGQHYNPRAMSDISLHRFNALIIALGLLASPTSTSAFQPNLQPRLRTKSSLFATSSRQKRVTSLEDWGKSNDIKTGGVAIESIPGSGLGLKAIREVPSGNLVVTVPAKVTLSVTTGALGGPDDFSVESIFNDRKPFRALPWYAQFSVYLYKLNKISSIKSETDLKPWLESLPTTFDTPIRWDKKQRDEWLQYQHMSESVDRQQEGT